MASSMAAPSLAASERLSSTSTSPTVIDTVSSSTAAATVRSLREKNAIRSVGTPRHATEFGRAIVKELSVLGGRSTVRAQSRGSLVAVKGPASERRHMADETLTSDKAVGLSLVFGVVAALGAGWMFAAGGDETAGIGFALAMIAASLSVVAVHLYWG